MMDISEIDKRLELLSNRGILSKQVASQVVCVYCDEEEKRRIILENINKIENLNDEDSDFFVKLNLYINEILY